MNRSDLKFSTRCIHAGIGNDQFGAAHTPLYDTTTFKFADTEKMERVMDGRDSGYFYTRYGSNPSIVNVEQKLAGIEGAEAALVFSSGMAAIAATLIAYGQSGIICMGEIYGGTWQLMKEQLKALGRKVAFIEAGDEAQLQTLLMQGYGLVYFETPSNPLLSVIDIKVTSDIAHVHGALVAIDSTFATPVNQQTLALGADLVIHSATKYLGGHSDLTGGVVAGQGKMLLPIQTWRKNMGQIMAPEVAHLLTRSLATLALRVGQQNTSALRLAHFLQQHPAIEQVYYPGLAEHAGHAIASRQMSGFGGMLSIRLGDHEQPASRFVDALKLFSLAASLGGIESLVSQPALTSHRDFSRELKAQKGITDHLVRLSVGLEDVEDLENDLRQALAC